MDFDRVLQPHVCCLGNPVAGNPTQFVMSKAAKYCGLDWQFFTSQVATEDFDAAMRGVQALGLQGVAILDPYQQQAIPYLDTLTQSALALQRVSVARSDGNSWLGDNLIGQSLWQIVCQNLLRENQTADAVDPGTKPVATKTLVYIGSEPMQQCLLSTIPNSDWKLIRLLSNTAAPESDGWSLDRLNEENLKVDALVVESSVDGNGFKWIQSMDFSSGAPFLHLPNLPDKAKRQWIDTLALRGARWVDQVEWMSAEAVANFHFWTGELVPLDFVRESLEEYMQW